MISAKSLLLGGLLLLAVAPGAGGASGPLSAKSVPAQKAADVPDAYTVSGHFTRIVVVRMKNQVDMLVGLRAALAREKIRNAVILSGAGSLVSYHVHVVSNTTLPATEAFFKGKGLSTWSPPTDTLSRAGSTATSRFRTPRNPWAAILNPARASSPSPLSPWESWTTLPA